MAEEKRSFWKRIFGGQTRSPRQERVLEYIVHRVDAGANLNDILDEEYVLRNLSRGERDQISSDPRVVEAARERMQKDFKAGKPDSRPR